MPTARLYRAALADPPASGPKVRLYRAAVTGTAAATPKVRLYRVAVTGTSTSQLQAFTPTTVDALTEITLTAQVVTGAPTPDSYVWRHVSGSEVAISAVGAVAKFLAPAHPDGTYTVVGVRAVKDGVSSAEQTVRIDARSHHWWFPTTQGSWVAGRLSFLS